MALKPAICLGVIVMLVVDSNRFGEVSLKDQVFRYTTDVQRNPSILNK